MFNFSYQGAGTLIYYVKNKDDVYVLLGKRSNNPDKDLWSIPGGGWEYKDVDDSGKLDYRETARRELIEETGFILPKDSKKLLVNIWNIDILMFKFVVYALRITKQKLPIQYNEFTQMKWFNINDIPKSEECNRFIHSQIHNLKKFLLKKGHLSKIK